VRVQVNAPQGECPGGTFVVGFRKLPNCNCCLHLESFPAPEGATTSFSSARLKACPDTNLGYPRNTIAGSIRVTLLIETSAAPTHISNVTKNIPTAMDGGIRMAAPPA